MTETRVPRGWDATRPGFHGVFGCGSVGRAGAVHGRVLALGSGWLAACRPGIRSSCPRTLLALFFAVSVSLGTRVAALSLATLVSSVAFAPAAWVAFCTGGLSTTCRRGLLHLLVALAARPRAGHEADGEPRKERDAVSHLAPLSRMFVMLQNMTFPHYASVLVR